MKSLVSFPWGKFLCTASNVYELPASASHCQSPAMKDLKQGGWAGLLHDFSSDFRTLVYSIRSRPEEAAFCRFLRYLVFWGVHFSNTVFYDPLASMCVRGGLWSATRRLASRAEDNSSESATVVVGTPAKLIGDKGESCAGQVGTADDVFVVPSPLVFPLPHALFLSLWASFPPISVVPNFPSLQMPHHSNTMCTFSLNSQPEPIDRIEAPHSKS